MNKKKSNIITYSIIGSVLILSVIAFIIQKNSQEKLNPIIIENLLTPYSNSLKMRDYERAYNSYTSINYRLNYTLTSFIASQDSNYLVLGKVIDIVPASGIFVKESSKDLPIFKATLIYKSEKTSKVIVMDVIFEEGKPKIEKTYNSELTIGTLTPKIY
jgi:hypothetical protein